MKQCRQCSNFFPDDFNVCPVDSTDLIGSEDKFIGKIVAGCYRILSRIGKGGMGTVYQAKHRYLEREVAVKVLKPSVSGDIEHRKRIIREAKICASIEHPNIVKVYDLASLEGSICLVMELLEGLTLKEMLIREGALNTERARKIMAMTAEALSRAHSFDIVHRDIKPGNIFLTHHRGIPDFVKLLDFGIAFTIGGSRLTKEGMLLGTPPYISPEQIQGQQATESSDVYALGCVVYEMLSGKSPFAAQRLEDVIRGHLFTDPQPITAIRPDVPPELNAIIMKMLQKDPKARYQDAFELLDDMTTAGLGTAEAERDALTRASEQPVKEGGHRASEIEWNQYFTRIADDIDEDTAQTMEFRQGLQAAEELGSIESEMKKLVAEMEDIENRRREYQKNIGVAVDSLEMDLSRLRKELGRERMEYLSIISEREYLIEKTREAEARLAGLASARPQAQQVGKAVDDTEVALLIQMGEAGKRIVEVKEKEKLLNQQREEAKAQIEDLKFQIVQLNNRHLELKGEYSEKYEQCRSRLDEISARGEALRKMAAMAASRVKLGDTTQKRKKGEAP